MKTSETKYIVYDNGKSAWLGVGQFEDGFNDITHTEIRKMLIADENKILVRGDEELGECVWLKDDDSTDNYSEKDKPEEKSEENE